ncbi:mucin-2 [Betta splendens]|uniref:Mucin-2 n=1 Tax=Betta splendens TaxID=158456 RepID=A0A9W2Y789_BETSP|nr:mucin-2 [Betta splendens]
MSISLLLHASTPPAHRPTALKQAGSEGELCQAGSLGSAGSSSTLASSVIEVETEREPRLTKPKEEEEELTPLSPPPTLSITEEILEFINQSRAKEGLASIHTDPVEQVQDEPRGEQPQSISTNSTCPLSPVSCASNPEQATSVQQQLERLDIDTQGHSEEDDTRNETTTSENITDDTCQVEKGLNAVKEEEGRETENRPSTGGEEQGESISPAAPPQTSISAETERPNSTSGPVSGQETNLEASVSSSNPDLLHPVEKRQAPTRGSHLSKRDKKIIEKIRSYYEAAAEAEEDEDDDQQEAEVAPRRRSSFSQIPSGLVKDSVSRFDVSGNQDPIESRQSKNELSSEVDRETAEEKEPITPRPAATSTDVEEEGQESLGFMDTESSPSVITQDEETLIPLSSAEDLHEAQEERQDGRQEDTSEEHVVPDVPGGTSAQGEALSRTQLHNSRDDTTQSPEQNITHKKITPPPHSEPWEPVETKAQSTWIRTKHRVGSGNLEALPSQMKVGRWSRHSRIVTANRAFFEGMASDVVSIRLFEATPVVDPVLMENSERILSKVQTLAQMYSAKASNMRVPLHHKRASFTWNHLWGSSKLSGQPTHTEPKSLTQQTTAKNQQETRPQEDRQSEPDPETKHEPQADSKTEVPNQTTTGSRKQRQAGNQTWNPIQSTKWDEKMVKKTESPTDDFQETAVNPCEASHLHFRAQAELHSSCGSTSPSISLDDTVEVFSALQSNEESDALDAAGGSEQRADQLLSTVSQECVDVMSQPSPVEPDSRALWLPQGTFSKDGDEQHKYDQEEEYEREASPTSVRCENLFSSKTLSEEACFTASAQRPARADTLHLEEGVEDVKYELINGSPSQTKAAPPIFTLDSSSHNKPLGEVFVPPPSQASHFFKHSQSPGKHEAGGASTTDQGLSSGSLSEDQEPDPPLELPDSPTNTWNVSENREPQQQASFHVLVPPNPGLNTSHQDPEPTPDCRKHSASPTRAPSISSHVAPPFFSPFRALQSSPTLFSPALSCLSPTFPSSRGSTMKAQPASSPTAASFSTSSSDRPSLVKAGPSTSPTLSPSFCSSSSAFTRSLAASCISQSISQNMARQQPSPTMNQSPCSPPSLPTSLRQRSPSSRCAPTHQGCGLPAYSQHPQNPPSSLCLSCPSPSFTQSHSQYLPPPSTGQSLCQPPGAPASSPRPSFLHSKPHSSQNINNNNNNVSLDGITSICNIGGSVAVSNGDWPVSQSNGGTHASMQQMWPGSHNRVARPFSASEPSSRVQSPSPSPTSASFGRLCSPTPQHNYSSPLANKPPNPRSVRLGKASQNPMGLTLELPGSASAQPSLCLSPRILSPPPIGVSVNVWTNVAAPQPRKPRFASSSPSFSSSSGTQVLENGSYPLPPGQLHNSSGSCSPDFHPTFQTLQRSFSSSLAERPPSPARSTSAGLRRSWAESSRRGDCRSVPGSFDPQESCPTSPRSGWSSYSGSPSCLSPRAGLQSPLLPSRLSLGKSPLGGQHFTSVPWPDVRELSNKYKSTDSLNTSATSAAPVEASAPAPLPSLSHTLLLAPDSHIDWGGSELEEGNCRSQLICAYIARPSGEQSLSSSCVVLSSTPPPVPYQHQVKPQPQAQVSPRLSPVTSGSRSSPLPFGHSSPTKAGNQKTSYATTVNLRIAGSGRITSFSTAQVSLKQTLQGGVGGVAQGQTARRVSVNGLSHLPSPLSQNCSRL